MMLGMSAWAFVISLLTIIISFAWVAWALWTNSTLSKPPVVEPPEKFIQIDASRKDINWLNEQLKLCEIDRRFVYCRKEDW